MAESSVSVQKDTRVLEKILAQLHPKTEAVLRDAAFRIQADAAIHAPYDTGALSNSMTAEPDTPLTWIIRDGVQYGIFNEMGTVKMPARPFLVPAVEAERSRGFVDAFRALFYT